VSEAGAGDGTVLSVGVEFAGFQIEELLGRGGMGTVYRVRDLALDHERALKVLEPALARDDAFRERFRRESRLAAQLEDRAVVPIYRAGEEGGRLFIAMRLVRGPDLHRLVGTDGPLEPRRAARIVGAVARALDAAHARGIVHRDVKPANILVELSDEGERVFLTDFGISRPAHATAPITSTGELVGTADYIAPEQIEGEPADARSDVYALGCVLCFLLTGEAPFRRENELATLYAHGHAARPRPSLLEPGLSEAIDDVVVQATAVDPAERYASAGELATNLQRAVDGAGRRAAAPESTAETRPLARPRSRIPLLAGALGLAAVATLAVVLIVGGGDGGDDQAVPVTGPPAVDEIRVGDPLSSIVVGNVNVLAASHRESTLWQIDPGSNQLARPEPIKLPRPSAVAVGFGSVWATSSSADQLLRYARGGREEPKTLAVGDEPVDVAVDDRWVWVANGLGSSIVQVDPFTDTIRATTPLPSPPSAVASGEGTVWATSPASGSVTRVRVESPVESARTLELGGAPSDVAIFDGSAWVIDSAAGTLTELELPRGDQTGEPIELGGSPAAIGSGPSALWVVDSENNTAIRIDPDSRDPGEPVEVGRRPRAVAIGAGSVWVANAGDGTVSRLTTR
jgi:streptogramin lyase/predicted Ser/Thr protein kinase